MSDKKIMKTLNGYAVYDEEAHRRIDSLTGSAPGLVFDTVADMEAYVAEHHAELKVGQNLYIREVDVPDYWWDGTAVQELEVKVDLSGYAKQEEVDSLSEAKADKSTVPMSADIDKNNLISFRSATGEVLFSLQLTSGGSGGEVEPEEPLSPFEEVNWGDTAYVVGYNSAYKYNGWCPGNARYDKTRNKIVFLQTHGASHSVGVQARTLCTINPYDITQYDLVDNFPAYVSGDGVGGLVVDSDGTWTVYGMKKRYVSSDGGATWQTESVITPPSRFFGINKIDGVLYTGDDSMDETHNGWYYTSSDDGLTWEQKVFDFADSYEISCSETNFCKFKGELYACLRREGASGILAKMVDGVWTVVSDEMLNVTSDTTMYALSDVICMAAIDRPNMRLKLATYDGADIVVRKEYDFTGYSASGDFHTPTYIVGDDFQAVFLMCFGASGNEYASAMNVAVVGYADGVNANTPTYEVENVTYDKTVFTAEPYANVSAVETTENGYTWTVVNTNYPAFINTTKRLPGTYPPSENGKVVEYRFCSKMDKFIHAPYRGANIAADVKTIDGRAYLCVTMRHGSWVGSFNIESRKPSTLKLMGAVEPVELDFDMTGAQYVANGFAYGATTTTFSTATTVGVVQN